jgi:hypothetical protein
MKGLQIFTHSVRQVFGNLSAALRVSGLLYLVQVGVSFAVGVSAFTDQAAMRGMMQRGEFPWGGFFLVLLVSVVTSLWIAVAWHRYVLKVEQSGILPPFKGDRILAYFLKGLLIFIILIPLLLILGFVAGIIVGALMRSENLVAALVVGALVIYLPIGVVGFRLSSILPGVAIGEGYGIADGWAATDGQSGALAVVVLLSIALGLVLGLPNQFLLPPNSVPALIWQLISGWIMLMVGISVLTTLYGHYIEKRPLV